MRSSRLRHQWCSVRPPTRFHRGSSTMCLRQWSGGWARRRKADRPRVAAEQRRLLGSVARLMAAWAPCALVRRSLQRPRGQTIRAGLQDRRVLPWGLHQESQRRLRRLPTGLSEASSEGLPATARADRAAWLRSRRALPETVRLGLPERLVQRDCAQSARLSAMAVARRPRRQAGCCQPRERARSAPGRQPRRPAPGEWQRCAARRAPAASSEVAFARHPSQRRFCLRSLVGEQHDADLPRQ